MNRDRHVQNHRFFKVSFPPYEIDFWGIFEPSFRKLHFLAICHVSKMTFFVEISRNRSFNCRLDRPLLRNLFQNRSVPLKK